MKPCSARQLWTALFVALLAPASALPAALVQSGTSALVWLAPLLVLPGALAVLWAVRRLGGEGLAAAWRGKGGLLTLYYLWAMALAALTAGGCVDRLHRTDYAETPAWLLALSLILAACWLARKGPAAFFRSVQIFFLALVVVTALFFVLGLADLWPENLAVHSGGELLALGQSLFPAAGSLAVGVLCAFFPWRSEPGGSSGWRWLTAWCAVAAGLCLLVLGALGPELTASAPLPFFLVLQGLGFPGGFRRLEALGTAAWVLSDVTLLALAALAGREMAGKRPWAVWPILLAGFLGGCLLPNSVVAGFGPWLWGVNLILGAAVPLSFALNKRTSCG